MRRYGLLLCSLLPGALEAQVIAGDVTGCTYTVVDTLLNTDGIQLPWVTQEVRLDLNDDGTEDIRLRANRKTEPTHHTGSTHVNALHSGVEVVAYVPGSYIAVRFDEQDTIDAGWTWASGYLYLAVADYAPFNPPPEYQTIGDEQWFHLGPGPNEGYLGVRMAHPDGMLYGWVHLTSAVSMDGAQLHIHDFAIQSSPTAVGDLGSNSPINAWLAPDGKVVLNGDLRGLLEVSVHDMAGHLVHRRVGGPFQLDLSGEAPGIYVLTLVEGTGRRSIKLVR